MLHRTFATGFALAVVAAGALAPVPSPARAAVVTLTELSASPLVSNFGGWDLGFATNSIFSSAAVGDVTGDGQPEIVVGGMNSIARVYDLTHGATIELNPGGANLATGQGATQASPALGDIDGDGVSDVVIANTGGRLAAYSVRNGTARELYNRFVQPAFVGALEGMIGTPALGYLDVDTQLDTVTSSWGQTLDSWSGPTGEAIPYQRQWLRDTIWSSPVIGDVDGDGANEIVVGADCEGSGSPQPCYGIGGGGYVWAFNLDGSVQWSYYVRDAVIWSTPALIDLNGDAALDVVVGTGLYFLGPAANKIMAIDGRSGQLLWNAPTGGPVLGSPSVATVDGQPRVWVVSGGGNLMSWTGSGQLLWQQCIMDQPCLPAAGTFGGVAIADVNNDGRLDAVVNAEAKLRVLDALTGVIQTEVEPRYGRYLFPSFATPTVADVNGRTWIVQVNIGDRNRNGTTDGGDDLVVSVWTTGTALGEAPWPTFKQNMARTGGPLPAPPPPPVRPGGRVCPSVAGGTGSVAIVNLTPVQATGPGYGLLVSSDVANPPTASNTNYFVNSVAPDVAFAPIGRDGRTCFVNGPSAFVHLAADHLGTIRSTAYTPAIASGAPDRKVDTRIGIGGDMLPPSGRLCFRVAGSPGDAAVVNLTPVEASGPGFGLLVSSDVATAPIASNANYAVGSVNPNVAIAPIGADGQVCFVNGPSASVHLVADHLGTIRSAAYTPAVASGAPDRKVDTRIGVGGTMVPPGGRLCFAVAGSPGDAAVVNLTPVEASGPGFGLLVSSDLADPPVASNANYGPGTIDPNVAIAPIGRNGQVCFTNAAISAVHLVADHLGTIRSTAYTPAVASGAPDRKVDTRIRFGAVPF